MAALRIRVGCILSSGEGSATLPLDAGAAMARRVGDREKPMAEQDCLFCRIAARTIPAQVVHETEHLLAFRDIDPKAPVHVLVIPKRHIASVNAVSAGDAPLLGELFVAARAIAEAEGLTDDGYRLVVNTGPGAGQTVWHIHLHLLGGRDLRWPPG